MKKGEISRCSLPFHPKASHKHHHTTPGLMEEDPQLWLDPLGWAGLAFPTWGSKERGTCVRLGQLSTEGFLSPRAGDTQGTSASSVGGGRNKENIRKTKLIRLKERAAAAEGAGDSGGGFTPHAQCDKKFHIFHSA